MIRRILNLLAWLSALLAGWAIWTDVQSPAPSRLLGAIWYDVSPGSLQLTETIISRFIDPCGLITALECSPFLWHPLISGLLTLPAALFFVLMVAVFLIIAQFFRPAGGGRRRSRRNLRREGR